MLSVTLGFNPRPSDFIAHALELKREKMGERPTGGRDSS